MDSSPPERRLSLAQQLVLDLSRRILAGELPAGSKLPTEQALTQERGVSRTVVREAMSRLQAEGLVETRRGIGTFVVDTTGPGAFQVGRHDRDPAYDEVAFIELRMSLEVDAAAIAAQRASAEQLQTLRTALDEANALPRIAQDSIATDFRFHLLIVLCTGNSFFIDAMTHMSNTLKVGVTPAPELADLHRQACRREREQIYTAISHRDPDGARAAMRLHLINCLQRVRVAQATTG